MRLVRGSNEVGAHMHAASSMTYCLPGTGATVWLRLFA